jgi:hypothetical protein
VLVDPTIVASAEAVGCMFRSVLGEDRFRAAATRLESAIADELTTDLVSELQSLAGMTGTTSAARGP